MFQVPFDGPNRATSHNPPAGGSHAQAEPDSGWRASLGGPWSVNSAAAFMLFAVLAVGTTGCDGLDHGDANAPTTEAAADSTDSKRAEGESTGSSNAAGLKIAPPVARRDRPRPGSISEEDWASIQALPPTRSGSDEVLFPPGDDDLMEPLVGTKEFSKHALEINPYELMPRDLPIADEHRAEIYELLGELQPLREDLTSDHHDRQFILNKRRIEALEKDDRPEVGWAALHAFTRFQGDDFHPRRTLLRIGARVSPKEATGLLKSLSFTYGYRLGDRAEAVLLLAETDPAALMEGARPYLERKGRPFQTAPSDEFYARAWITACERTGESPVPMMSEVAMNIALEPIARYVALEELGDHGDDPLARAALQEALVESTGDGYLRRKAAQGIIKGFPSEDACALLQEVLRNESDQNMARFLDDMVQTNCR
ncbi:hypothetical protein Poly30_38920 [Planctomycetes bacterium Poly30]|uniref:HEAT repeat protein n=1 Tax=Saltatorellus ferox TaxID=2528018 RepID=A0A518EW97_9BACT|nr:hypothetical protein Poly30_38920 [Planctomycetes bacterium Poly30]